MGKITKMMQAKHKETLSPWLKSYVESACTTALPLLPDHLAEFPSRWPFGRGDLYHWIPLLNRFDAILEKFCTVYELDKGPQPRDFGCELLLHHNDDPQLGGNWRDQVSAGFELHPEIDRLLIEAVLRFTNMLLEHCGNRSIYASSGHLNDLLNSTSWTVLIATLEVSSELAQRYQASVRRVGSASRQISTALLANHYNIDLERVQQLASPFVKTPIIGLGEPVSSTTPASSSKSKDKSTHGGTKGASVLHANDLLTVAFSDDTRWAGWGDVRVTYYPEEPLADQNSRADNGRSSQPSTPTPLRRSHTVSTQNQTTPRARNTHGEESSPLGPKTPGIGEEQTLSGHKLFELPQSIVAATSVQDLVSRCPTDMPSSSKYEVFNRVRVAKALLGPQETRQNALAVRLLAITNLAYIHNESNFVEKVLRQDVDETRRFQLVYQLAELIRPSTDGITEVPTWLQTIALTLLEAVANLNARCQDVLAALNANVNHGVLLYVIRKAVASMKNDDDAEDGGKVTREDEWRDSLFSLTLYLSMHTRAGPEMVSAGLMEILVDMLKIRSKIAQRHHSMVVGFLDGLIWTYQNAFTAFFAANGLDAVADLVVDTVREAQSLMNANRGTTPDFRSSAVDYRIPYYQQQTLRWLLKFIHHIMSNSYTYGGNTDRLLRNLADKSDLLASLREVMADKQSFGSVDWTNSVTILSDFINNDPTSFTVIMESGMIKTYLEAITGYPVNTEVTEGHGEDEHDEEADSPGSSAIIADLPSDDRSHPPPEEELRQADRGPLATGILASSEAINVVPQVLNSISLNNAGMKLVVSSRAFDRFFEIFESSEHVRSMELDSDLAGHVGGSFDELARHHPALRTSISNAVIDMVARVQYLGVEKSRSAGWGVKLYMTKDGSPVSVSSDGSLGDATNLGIPNRQVPTEDSDIDMTGGAQSQDNDRLKPDGSKKDSPDDSFTPYIFAVSTFLSAYLNNNVLKSSFIEKGGMEILLDMCESPSLAANFGDSLASRVLGQVIATLVEFSPVRGLPSILNRAQAAVDIIQPIASKSEPVPPYFAPFLASDLSVTQADDENSKVVSSGTKMMKALLNAQTFIKILSECFLSSRSNTQTFYPVNVYDHFLRLIESIGPLLRGVLAEEAGQLTMVPQNWSGRRNSPIEDSPQGAVTDPDADRTPLPDVLNDSNVVGTTDAGETGAPSISAQEQSSPRFQNYEVFRNLLHPMIPTTFPLFQAVGKALLPRREPSNHGDSYTRSRQIELAKALADAVLDHLRPSVATPEPSSKDFHYWIIMLHTVHEMLVENSHPRHSDRSSVQLIMPVLLAFKEEGGLEVLNSMLGIFARCVEQKNDAPEESSKPKVAAFGLKKILDLYGILTNGKFITETNTAVNLQRNTDRSSTVPNIYTQFVVEVRALILPAIADLWTSSIVESLPDQTAKRLIDILKLISLAEHEPPSTLKDKAPFCLLKYNDARFNWASARNAINELVGEFDKDLVHEAVFRANGSSNAARDYCKAHQNQIAGAGNPIPPEDADTSASSNPPPAEVHRTPSNGTGSSDGDRMSLDDSEALSGENLGGLVDLSHAAEDNSQALGGNDNGPSSSTAAAAGAEDAATTAGPQLHQFVATRQDLDKQRENLRKDLIDRCLDVIRTHPDTAMEVSDLINAMVIRQQNQELQDEVCSTLTFALSSLALDEDEKKRNGRCIATYSHLLALLLQDEGFFQQNLDNLRTKVDEYISFVRVPSPTAAEDLPPWIPYILLVLEILLRQDARPVPAQWQAPKSLDDPVAEPVIDKPTPLVDGTQRELLIDSVLELLPRIGKEEVLATSALRVLVILTRNRTLAKRVGDKKNLQRLFLMAKQLAGFGSERLKQSRTTAHIIMILRHIVEDEDVLRQVMRAEIKSEFMNVSRGNRAHPDLTTYLRHMTPLALRAPDLFVDVTNEVIEIQKWTPASAEHTRPPYVTLKSDNSHDTAREGQETQETQETRVDNASVAPGVKPSTEPADKDMTDAPRSQQDTKRPQVENPDGVVHFLLSELVNYREVDDKEPVPPSSDSKPDPTPEDQAKESQVDEPSDADAKDKKPQKPVFKPEEHPIYIYRCFLLNCLTELLQSYNRTKVEFINFKRSAPPLSSNTPVKPRSSVLNYLIYDLLCQVNLTGTTDSITAKKKATTSAHTQKVLVALVSKTKEKPLDRTKSKFAYDDESDLQFVRKFVLDTVLKAYERAPTSDGPLETRYSRMQSLAELMNHMIGERDREHGSNTRSSDNVQTRSQAQLRRMMYEKGFLEKLTSSIAEINLNYPGVKRAIKYILRVLRILTDTAKELSHSNLLPSNPAEVADDDIGSTSSLSDLEDDREETPDLYRNSSLGMLEPGGGSHHDESDEDDEDGEDMYGDEYDDEMDYDEEEMSEDEQDNISEDSEMGEIEGLPGDPGVVEVIMNGEEDDDEGDDDDSEEEDDDDDEDDDDLDSADMEDVEDRVEIVNEEGDPIDDDGNSDWESESDGADEDEMDPTALDYEAEAQDPEEAHLHGMPPGGGLLGNMARALMEGDEYDPDLMDEHYPDDDLDDEEEEEDEDDIEEPEYLYDDEYPLDDQPPPMPGLGWDGINPEADRNRLVLLDNHHQRRRVLTRMDNRSPFPPGFVVGGAGGDPLGGELGDIPERGLLPDLSPDFRSYFSRHHRSSGPQPTAEDGLNPLLRRHDQRQDNHPRPGHLHPPSIGLRIPDGLLAGGGRRGLEGPMGILGELMDILPVMGRDGQAFQLHISGPGGPRDGRDNFAPRPGRHDHRRDGAMQEPHQAVAFQPKSTMERYDEEAKMIFGSTANTESLKLTLIVHAKLTPAAMDREKKFLAEEAERKRKLDLERQEKEEQERQARAAKELEEKEAKEKEEAEAREAAERAAEEAAATAAPQADSRQPAQAAESGAMEGVEATEPANTGQATGEASSAPEPNQPRVMAMLGNQEYDVTDLGIDPDYLAALPEEFREEVIAQTISTRRSQARDEASTGESPAAFQEFLEALPPQLRREIEQQEAQEQRRRDNSSARPAVSAGARDAIAGDMDPASILLTFPPELREQVLMEQGNEIMDQLPPDMAEQARRLQRDNSVPRPTARRTGMPIGRPGPQPPPPVSGDAKVQRRTVVQMLDKAGVATLVRLMFIAQQGSIRNYLFNVFGDICENRQNRLEVVSTILQILQEGSTDMSAVDRSFSQLSLKARRQKEKDADQKTPQSLKRTLTTLNTTATTQTNSETSPLLIVQQCLDLLVELCKNTHVPWLFLTEHETVGSTLKRTLSKKGKGKDKDTRAHKFAINSLLTLLDRELVMESSVVMTHLADLLNKVTMPLLALERRRKEAEQEKEAASNKEEKSAEQPPTTEQPTADHKAETTPAHSGQPDKSATAPDESSKKDEADGSQKKARPLQPPLIPPQNLTLVVRTFVARECSSKTFQNTISTIKNLSTIPGAKKVFGDELVNQAQLLSKNIVADLDDLLPHIENATSGTEIQGLALAKFSPGASEQNKLLRVLTALDHLFDSKKKPNQAVPTGSEDEKQDLLASLYHNSTFSAMWDKLSTCLTAIHERENMLNVATILLPLIESLMVVCKNTTATDDQSQSQSGREMVMSSPPPESRTANLFFSFTEDHRRILNELVRNNPKLMSGTFALLVKNPKVLEFDNKRNYFNRSVHSRTGQPHHGRPSYPSLNLSVRRDQVFHDSFRSLYFKSGDEMKFGKLNIRFHGEEGVDAGGVTREWFQVLARQMFDPNYALFIPVSSDRTTFHPNKLSGINDEHLMFFKFIGRIIGKALYEGRLLDCFFSRAVYKRILGKSVSVKDMESFDPDYYKSLCWMLENDITDIITETFSVEDDEFGVTNVVDLIPNGRDIPVTEDNKHDYVRLVVEHKLLSSVKQQMEHFLNGFHDIIPAELISIFNEQELELLISGLPDIDIDDWKSNTEYHNYNPSSPQIQWFWRAVRSFDKEERAKLVQFVTGTSKVPLNGFKELEGMNGINRFNIHRDYSNTDRLPTSHTCFNQLDLPEYESYDILRSQIFKAISAGSEYFGFA